MRLTPVWIPCLFVCWFAAGCQTAPPVSTEPATLAVTVAPEEPPPSDTTAAVKSLTPGQIAMIDQTMRAHLAEKEGLENELAKLRAAGVMDENVKVKQLRQQIDAKDKRIDAYEAEWKDAQVRLSSGRYAEESASLRRAFPRPVDLYMDPAELQTRHPAVAGARFVDVIDVAGRKMLKFTSDRESWLIDPARILAVKAAQ